MQNPAQYLVKQIKRDPLQWALAFSVIVHFILLVFSLPEYKQQNNGEIARGPLQIRLAPKLNKKPPLQPSTAQPKIAKAQPKPKIKPKPKLKPPKKVMAKKVEEKTPPETFTVPEEIAQIPTPIIEAPAKIEPLKPTDSAPTDMMSLIKQRREARAAQGDPSAINALEEGKLSGQTVVKTPNQIAAENLKQGTNGIFTVTTLNRFEGVFAFQGWQGEYSNAQRRFYRVETFTPQDDIRVLMVNRMIAIIRTHYDGEFQWQSHRLGNLVTLSAHPKDNDKLVRFLLAEFKVQFDKMIYR